MALRKPGLEAEVNKKGFGLYMCFKKIISRLVFLLYYAQSEYLSKSNLRCISHCIGGMRLVEIPAQRTL